MHAPSLPQDDRLILSYIRQPGEEAEAMTQAARRLGLPVTPRRNMAGFYLVLGIAGGALLSLFLNVYRSLILVPAFGLTPLIDVPNLALICFFPCLTIYVLLIVYLKREAHLNQAAVASRIRPDVTVTVTVAPDAIVWEWSGAAARMAWNAVSDIAERDGRIEFDSDASVRYIPAHAFHNEQEQAAVLRRVQALWKPSLPAKP
jgi:hypothetical protein